MKHRSKYAILLVWIAKAENGTYAIKSDEGRALYREYVDFWRRIGYQMGLPEITISEDLQSFRLGPLDAGYDYVYTFDPKSVKNIPKKYLDSI